MAIRFITGILLHKLIGALHRLSESFYEWRFGITSGGEIFMDRFGIFDDAYHQYIGVSYVRFRQLMKLITIREGKEVFLDLGSGMGRAVVLAATFPFRKVIGVELVADLNSIATENVRRALPRLRCRDIELHNMDATNFTVPPEVTVIFLWNPFSGHVLEMVFRNIRRSIEEYPRAVTILHLSPCHPTALDLLEIPLPWLREHSRIPLGAQSVAVIYGCGNLV